MNTSAGIVPAQSAAATAPMLIVNGPVAREGLRRPYCDLYQENMSRLIPQTTPR